jgi:hypothetical protein
MIAPNDEPVVFNRKNCDESQIVSDTAAYTSLSIT